MSLLVRAVGSYKSVGRFLLVALILSFTLGGHAADWQSEPGFRFRHLNVEPAGKTGFELVPATVTGVVFSNNLPQSVSLTNQILLDGSGVAAGDVDGDGWCDLYFCAINGRNTLYRNLGNWKFEDITEQAGVGCAGLRSTGAAFADLDGNGTLDLIVNTAGNGTHVFYNDGHGHFKEAATVLNPNRGGKSLALADVDGDGYLDMYVVNYRRVALMDEMSGARLTFKMVNGKQTIDTFNGRPIAGTELADRFQLGPEGDFQENGEPDVLYRNIGGTNFAAIPFTGGAFLDEEGHPLAKPPMDWGLSAMFRDINGDGLPDLYVCNDFQTPDRFWINQGGGHFRLLPPLAQRKTSISSMAVDFADINRDGYDDFFVVDMMSRDHSQRMRVPAMRYPIKPAPPGEYKDRPQYEVNTLFLNRGDSTFAEIAQLSGVEASEWTWSGIFLDVDLDGWEDILIANGVERDGRDLDVSEQLKQLRAGRQVSRTDILNMRRMFPRQANGNLAFRNRGDLTFGEVGKAWGFDWKGVSSGMCLADLDNDGDLDVVINTLNGPALLYRNESNAPRLAVRLKGRAPNTRGIGARLAVQGGAVPVQTQEIICGGRYLSCDDTMRVFAAGSAERLNLEVTWPGGRRSFISNALPNCIYQVDETAAADAPSRIVHGGLANSKKKSSGTITLFEDASEALPAIHHEDSFDDFQRQPLLPNKLSQLGPGVAWFDIDGDGREDLVLGSGKGGRMAIYQNATNGFQLVQEPAFSEAVLRDQTGVLGTRLGTNKAMLLVGSSNYEDGSADGAAVLEYDLQTRTVQDAVASDTSSTGPLALADIDGSGKWMLFVGGRVIPGRYPEPASSRVFRYEDEHWRLDAENSRVLQNVGLVSGAIFSDLDGDGLPELILACEWGPLHIFHNNHGRLEPWNPKVDLPSPLNSQPSTLNELTGWWNSVAVGDFDGDGRLDLVAGNWGRNTKYQAHRARPLRLYYGDFRGDGSVEPIEAHWEPSFQKWVPERRLESLGTQLPWLYGRFDSYRAFSIASIEEILEDHLNAATNLQVNCLESVVLLNRGDHFEVRYLPVEAQMSPAFGLCVGDLDGDGNQDLFLAQNFFATSPETPRYDAGRGLLLKGDGHGGFVPISGQDSGIKVYGEQRGAALCDYDGDGRLDLAVTQNGAELKLYHNRGARPGLRVRLKGPANNPTGIGAVLRLRTRTGWGPAQEIHIGSGYWSQDSCIEVLSSAEPPVELQVRWPGGKVTNSPVATGAREVQIESD